MRILVAFDGSPSSRAAAEELCRRPWPPGSRVRIVTVLPYLEPYLNGLGGFPTTSASEYLMKQQGDEAAKLQAALLADLKRREIFQEVSAVLLEGRPKDVIIDEAERWEADLILLGSHGFGMLGRLLLGSVSLAVAINAPCSVEVVRQTTEVTNEPRQAD